MNTEKNIFIVREVPQFGGKCICVLDGHSMSYFLTLTMSRCLICMNDIVYE